MSKFESNTRSMRNLLLAAFSLILISCNQEPEEGEVTYQVYSFPHNATVTYLDENGQMQEQYIGTTAWKYTFIAEEGTRGYVKVESHRILSNAAVTVFWNSRTIDRKSAKGNSVTVSTEVVLEEP